MELSGFTAGCEDFLRQWNDGSDCICAHTSGSTGVPKKIHLSKSDMMKSAAATNRFFGIGCDSLLHLPLSTDYIAGKMMVVRGFVAGCAVMAERPSNHPLKDYAGRRISLSAVVPSQVPGLLDGSGWRFVDNLIVGAHLFPRNWKKLSCNME